MIREKVEAERFLFAIARAKTDDLFVIVEVIVSLWKRILLDEFVDDDLRTKYFLSSIVKVLPLVVEAVAVIDSNDLLVIADVVGFGEAYFLSTDVECYRCYYL